MKIKYALIVLVLSLLLIPKTYADYRIENITGNIYRFVDDRHRSVFAVTSEGIIVTDPLNPKAAKWLNKKLKQRFDKPVKYIIYSHNHSDHIYGAAEFDDPGITIISHHLTQQDIIRTRTRTLTPERTFTDAMTVELGDTQLELRYHGPNDGRGSISMLFKPEKVLFVVDWIVVGRMPWQRLWSYDIRGMINSTEEVLELDFDYFVGGHAEIGNKADVANYLNYLQQLENAVIDGIHNAQTLEQIQEQVHLPEYQHLPFYKQWLHLNVAGVYERLMEESGMGWRPDIP
ncbi:MAG: MBL fold metallo-hydrolase [Neptuniibacter sp.]